MIINGVVLNDLEELQVLPNLKSTKQYSFIYVIFPGKRLIHLQLMKLSAEIVLNANDIRLVRWIAWIGMLPDL